MTYVVMNGKLVKVIRNRRFGGTNISALVNANVEKARKAKLKGKKNGNCNVTACQRPGATWWNVGTRAYYCEHCAKRINSDGCARYNQPDLCYPSEEAAMMARAAQF